MITRTEEALAIFKTRKAIAKALKISPAAVSQWGEIIPIRRRYELEQIVSSLRDA